MVVVQTQAVALTNRCAHDAQPLGLSTKRALQALQATKRVVSSPLMLSLLPNSDPKEPCFEWRPHDGSLTSLGSWDIHKQRFMRRSRLDLYQ